MVENAKLQEGNIGVLPIYTKHYIETTVIQIYFAFIPLKRMNEDLSIDSSTGWNLSTFQSMQAVQSVKWWHSKCVPQTQNLKSTIVVSLLV